MKEHDKQTQVAACAILAGLAGVAGLCVDRSCPIRGGLVGAVLGAAAGALVTTLIARQDRSTDYYSQANLYYDNYETETGL